MLHIIIIIKIIETYILFVATCKINFLFAFFLLCNFKTRCVKLLNQQLKYK